MNNHRGRNLLVLRRAAALLFFGALVLQAGLFALHGPATPVLLVLMLGGAGGMLLASALGATRAAGPREAKLFGDREPRSRLVRAVRKVQAIAVLVLVACFGLIALLGAFTGERQPPQAVVVLPLLVAAVLVVAAAVLVLWFDRARATVRDLLGRLRRR
jgi:hypothetical protein